MGCIDFIPTGAWEVQKHPQFIEESAYGVTDLEDNVFQPVGIVTEVGMEVTIEEDVVRILGSRDIYNQIKLGIGYAFAVRYRPQGTKFMRYGTELPSRTPVPDNTMVAPNGTNFVSLSLLLSAYIDDAEKWRIYKGIKTGSIEVAISRDAGIEVTQNFVAKDITEWVAEPIWVNNQYAGAVTGNPWTGTGMGPNPLNVAATVVQCPEFNFAVEQGLGELKATGIESVCYLSPTNRDITLDFITWVYNNVRIGQVKDHTALALTYLMNAGASASFAGVKFNSYSSGIVGGSTDALTEALAGSAKTLTIPVV